MNKSRFIAFALLLCAGILVWIVSHQNKDNIATNHQTATGLTLPEFQVTTLDGNLVNLKTFTQKPLVINFWSSWCKPCITEMPILSDAQKRYEDIVFVFANQGDTRKEVENFLQKNLLNLNNVWLDEDLQLGNVIGNRVLPTTLIFNEKGERIAKHTGVISKTELEKLLKQLKRVH